MTKKLEELFNLPEPDGDEPVEMADPRELFAQGQQQLESASTLIDRIDQALPQVRDLDSADAELDELSDMAKEKFEDLMNLGMNVEARFSGQILQTAGVLLGHAITAKQAKIDKKLKIIDLQLKKMRLDQTANKDSNSGVKPVEGQAVVVDRNELLKQIMASRSEKNPE
jgi:hypothetical protein